MNIIIASSNKHKIEEINEIVKDFKINFISASEYDVDMESVVEDGKTFVDNALIKARFLASKLNEYVLADDSGLCLEGSDELGVHTARFRQDLTYPERCQVVYEMVKDNPKASFICSLALITPSKEEIVVTGEVKGEIKEPSGSNGFGYDPVFYSYELKKIFGTATSKEKHSVSHRGRAVRMLVEELKKRGLVNE